MVEEKHIVQDGLLPAVEIMPPPESQMLLQPLRHLPRPLVQLIILSSVFDDLLTQGIVV